MRFSTGLAAVAVFACVNMAWLTGVVPAAAPTAPPDSAPISFQWQPGPGQTGRSALEVSGLARATLRQLDGASWTNGQWSQLLSVFADQGDLVRDLTLPPMLGTYRLQSDALRFEPTYAWVPGVHYRAVFHPDRLPGSTPAGRTDVVSHFRVPPPESKPSTVVREIYPSADELPENLLKFYVHFSAPMSRGHIYEYIHLNNEAGRAVELPFLEIDEELWNPDMNRLTLFIDPGRIKRGVKPLEEVGPSIENGKKYTLVIDREWHDSAGQPLMDSFRRTFRVGPPDRQPPDPAQWKIESPGTGSTRPLTIQFPKPMDHALALRVIRLMDSAGRPVMGTVALTDHERRWSLTPGGPWVAGSYEVVIGNTIEDLAGNNIGKPFDVDVFERVTPSLADKPVKLRVEIR